MTDQANSVMSYNTGWQQSPDLIAWQLNPDDLLDDIEHFLKGEERIGEAGNQRWEKTGEALVTAKGARKIRMIVSSHVNKHIIMSNLSEEDVRRIAWENRRNIAQFVYLRFKDFKIRKSDFDTIVQAVDHMVFAALKRALNEGERKGLRQVQRWEQRVETEAKKESGWGLNWFKGGGSK